MRGMCAVSEAARAQLEGTVVPSDRPSLRRLGGIRPLYMLPNDSFAEDVLIPSFRNATNVDCMVGFFSSEVLASIAPGLATYIVATKHSLQLIVSPMLSAEDQAAIQSGLTSPQEVADSRLANIMITEDRLRRHTLECLSWLLRQGRLRIKVALMTNALFHPKVWLFTTGDDILAAHGSSNMTNSGLTRNIEQVAVSRSWLTGDQNYTTSELSLRFSDLWADQDDDCIVVPMSDAIRQSLIRTYPSDSPPTEEQYLSHCRRAMQDLDRPAVFEPGIAKRPFSIPRELRYTDGPFAHQGDAVRAWCDQGYKGILEMATGSGKTITAMICAHTLYQVQKPLLIVVAAPYVPLVDQWCGAMSSFGLVPVNMSAAGGAAGRARELERVGRRFRGGLADVAAVVVSHDTLCSPRFVDDLDRIPGSRLLIADEAHNLGRRSFVAKPPTGFPIPFGSLCYARPAVRRRRNEGAVRVLRTRCVPVHA